MKNFQRKLHVIIQFIFLSVESITIIKLASAHHARIILHSNILPVILKIIVAHVWIRSISSITSTHTAHWSTSHILILHIHSFHDDKISPVDRPYPTYEHNRCQELDQSNCHLGFRNIILSSACSYQSSESWKNDVENGSDYGDWFRNIGHVRDQSPYLTVNIVHY